jgi:hypothetical protein
MDKSASDQDKDGSKAGIDKKLPLEQPVYYGKWNMLVACALEEGFRLVMNDFKAWRAVTKNKRQTPR